MDLWDVGLRIVLGLLLLVSTFGCSRSPSPAVDHEDQQILRRGLGGEPASLDPAAAADNFSTQVVQDLYEGLTTELSTGEIGPGVASSWTVDSTRTQYTFQLRTDARWSNGKQVRAQEFISAWQRVLNPKLGSPVANDLRLINGAAAIISGAAAPSTLGVEASSDTTLIVKLVRPAPYFLQLLTHSAAFPIYTDATARSHDPNLWVSDGPYVLKSWAPGSSIELTKNLCYWDAQAVKVNHLRYQIASDQNVQLAEYLAGQLDVTDTVPPNAIPSLRVAHAKEIVIAPYLATAYYGFNSLEPPLAGNLPLRKALAMAIDRHRLVDALALGQIAAYGFVPPGVSSYTPQQWEWANLSDEERSTQAKQLFFKAGYTKGKPLHLRLLFNSNPAIKQTAIMIAAMWKEELGIDTEFTAEEFRVFLESRHDKKKWDIIRLAWNADYNDASSFLDIFREKDANNDVGYFNPLFENLLNQAEETTDQARRSAYLAEAERSMLEDYTAVPLYFYVSKRLVKPYVSGLKPNPFDRIASRTLAIVPH
jgi:oligopeptide transport system substrate-binding protein